MDLRLLIEEAISRARGANAVDKDGREGDDEENESRKEDAAALASVSERVRAASGRAPRPRAPSRRSRGLTTAPRRMRSSRGRCSLGGADAQVGARRNARTTACSPSSSIGRIASYAAWYEMFPRSQASVPGRSGTFKDCERRLS